jgi:hypothetical protein
MQPDYSVVSRVLSSTAILSSTAVLGVVSLLLVISSALFISVLFSALFFSVLSFAESECEYYVTIDGQSASLSWNKAPIWGLRQDFYYCRTVAGLLMLGALSDERTGLSFVCASGSCQRSLARS